MSSSTLFTRRLLTRKSYRKERGANWQNVVICGGVTVYALGDMMIHNRRKRAEFFTEQKALKASAIQYAQAAIEHGTATEDQIAFIRREEEHDAQVIAAAAAKAAKRGIFRRGKDWLFSGLKNEEGNEGTETNEGRLGNGSINKEYGSIGTRESGIAVQAIEGKKALIPDTAKRAFKEEKERQRTGGPLDRLGTAQKSDLDDEDGKPASGGWTSFMVRR